MLDVPVFPSFPDVLLLLLVLNQMLTLVFDEQNAPVVQLGEEIGVESAGGSWQAKHPNHVAHPALRGTGV